MSNLKKYRGFILVAALAIMADFFFLNEINVIYDADSIYCKGGLIGVQVNYDDVTGLEWRESFEIGDRVSGIDTLRYSSGEFEGGDLEGTYDLLLDRHYTGQILVIHAAPQSMVIGSSNVDMTKLYDTIAPYVEE